MKETDGDTGLENKNKLSLWTVRAASLCLSPSHTPGAVPATAWAFCPLLHTHDTERVCQTTCRVMLSKIYGRHENDGKAELEWWKEWRWRKGKNQSWLEKRHRGKIKLSEEIWVIRALDFPLLHAFSKWNSDRFPKMSSFLYADTPFHSQRIFFLLRGRLGVSEQWRCVCECTRKTVHVKAWACTQAGETYCRTSNLQNLFIGPQRSKAGLKILVKIKAATF